MINKRLLGRLLSSTSSGALAALRLDFSGLTLDPRVTFARASNATVNDARLEAPSLHLPFASITPGQYVSYGLTFARGSHATLVGPDRMLTFAPNNLLLNSATLSTQSVTVTGAWHIVSFKGTGQIVLSGAATGTIVGTSANDRVFLRFKPTAGSLTLTVTGSVTNARLSAVTYETAPRDVDDYETTAAAYYGPRRAYDRLTGDFEGVWVEETRTCYALHNRNLADAVWTKTNVTAAQDQVGVDGVANSASSIVATAANGTVLQSITDASRARCLAADVKRLNGTGTIQMTMDNGTTWTSVTVTSTTQWTRVSIPSQTLANPVIGFRIATSGDAIAVDFVQTENGAVSTSRIFTEAAQVARAAETLEITGSAFSNFYNSTEGTFIVEWEALDVSASSRYLWSVSDGTNNNRNFVLVSATSPRAQAVVAGVSGSTAASTPTVSPDVLYKMATLYSAAGYANVHNGGTVASVASTWGSSVNKFTIGAGPTGATNLNAKIRSVTYYRQRLSDSRVQALTT